VTSELEASLLAEAWEAVASGETAPDASPPEVDGAPGLLPSRFAVQEVAVACVGAALMAAAALQQGRGGRPAFQRLDRAHVAAAVRSEVHFQVGGRSGSPGSGFAPLSRFWRAADGWVRTHGNYPWHRDALLRALGCAGDQDAVAEAIGRLPAEEVEERAFAAGGIAAAVRSLDAWRRHPQGRAVAAEPLIGHRRLGEAAPRARAAAELPAGGVRVLDLTRVIAGPVCTRYLAALGAEVLRIDPPGLPDLSPGAAADSLLGKRNSLLSLRSEAGAATLRALLERADVLVHGYRPGALDPFGLGAEALAERCPALVVVSLDAWGHGGPWSGRRGFDSIVQAPSGIAAGESPDGERPGALPCQLLDHGTATWPRQRRWTASDARRRRAGRTSGGCRWRARPGGWPGRSRSARPPRVARSPARVPRPGW
jgi:CoA-transferase family III